MYSNFHGSIGVAIVTTTYLITKDEVMAMAIGGFLSFLAHDPTDRLGEHNLGKYFLLYEIFPFIIAMAIGWYSGFFWMFFVGYFTGNIMDVWDKKLYLAILMPKKFKMLYDFPCHRRERSKIKQLTLQQTKDSVWIGLVLVVISAALMFFNK